MTKRLLFSSVVLTFIIILALPLNRARADYSQMPEYLCEIGLNFYNQGRREEALDEFRKALLVCPGYEPALQYISMIEGEIRRKQQVEEPDIISSKLPVRSSYKAKAIEDELDLFEMQREIVKGKMVVIPKEVPSAISVKALELKAKGSATRTHKTLIPLLNLKEQSDNIQRPVEIEQFKSLIIIGDNIRRFLLTSPDILLAELNNKGEIVLTGKNIGYTYLHVWDDSGRRTIEILCVLPKPEGPTLEEEMRLEEERASAFKLRYSLSWQSFLQGRRLDSVSRQYYSFDHNLSLNGQTPYGDIDSLAIARTLNARSSGKSSDLRYFSLGLTEGKLWNFKDFSLRAFDFYPDIDNYAFSGGTTLRGGMLESLAFDKKLDYIVFWGREGGGKFGPLSPGLQKLLHSYITGARINYSPDKQFNYDVSVFHGYGRERPINLPDYSYDANLTLRLENWLHNYEIAYESEYFAHLLRGRYTKPRTNFTYEFRDVSKQFINIIGNVWRRGELGGLFTLNLTPNEKLNISQRLDVYQDRLFPAEDNKNRLNEDYDLFARYTLDPTTSLRTNYTFQNDLGKLSQIRYLSSGAGVSKSFNLIRNISSNLDYRHQESTDFTNPSNSYINENVSTGLRFSLLGQLYFFANQQWNWLNERFTGSRSTPQVFETGLDLSSQILSAPFYEQLRFIYHNEEDANSNLSYLSGEDYIEGYAELSFRPTPDTESYISTRVRNVWADNPNVAKRIEADINAGFRYVWDTGVHWEAVGNIEGLVFRDLNSDGLRQKDEAPVEGIKLWLGKKRNAVTDLFGYYKFTGVRGKKAHVTIDTQSLPSGFVLTTPQRVDVGIEQSQTVRADFGIISRSEISGIVFFDANNNDGYDSNESGIKNVRLIMENGKEAVTGNNGRYSFRSALSGNHKITIDLNSLPTEYLPKAPINKELTLFEGVSYIYNIPLKKINE